MRPFLIGSDWWTDCDDVSDTELKDAVSLCLRWTNSLIRDILFLPSNGK